MFEIRGKFTSAKVMIDQLEPSCVAQVTSFVNHPAFTNSVAIMPDAHTGKGSCIGFTMPMTNKVIAQIIGVDIGCGMLAINIGPNLPLSLDVLDYKIRRAVPFGMNTHDKAILNMEREFPFRDVRGLAHNFSLAYNQKFGTNSYFDGYDYRWFVKKCHDIGANLGRVCQSIGTLGGGNHFIEVGKDDNGDYWIVIHTGSRNFGKCVCDYWQNMASSVVRKDKQEQLKSRIEEIRKTYTGMEIKAQIKKARASLGLDAVVSDELQYLEGENAHGYLYDMIFAQKYAKVNRAYIASTILKILGVNEIDRIETVHNFIDFRDFIIRKGAIRSYVGERMIIPFNPRDGILICDGKSNPDWNYSAPHGAGRVMSRSQAKKNITDEMAENAMKGIFASAKPKDESPLAYKDAKIIEEAIEPTANIFFRIKPVLNMKDSGGTNTD